MNDKRIVVYENRRFTKTGLGQAQWNPVSKDRRVLAAYPKNLSPNQIDGDCREQCDCGGTYALLLRIA